MMPYKYVVNVVSCEVYKYMEDDEFIYCYKAFRDFKDAKHCLLEALDKKVKRALNLTSRNYDKDEDSTT